MAEETNYYDFEKDQVRALGNRVFIKLLPLPKVSKGGIHLLEGTEHKREEDFPNRGRVLSIGKDVTLDIKIGDIVVFDPRGLDAAVRRDFKNLEEAFIVEKHIFAVIENLT